MRVERRRLNDCTNDSRVCGRGRAVVHRRTGEMRIKAKNGQAMVTNMRVPSASQLRELKSRFAEPRPREIKRGVLILSFIIALAAQLAALSSASPDSQKAAIDCFRVRTLSTNKFPNSRHLLQQSNKAFH